MIKPVLLLALWAHVPLPFGASGRELDWESVARAAEERAKELKKTPCGAESTTAQVEALIDENQRLAAFFDLAARNLPLGMPSRDRARKIYQFVVKRSVPAYERAFHCRPIYERRDLLFTALRLLHFAVRDLESHPGESKEGSLGEYQEHEARLRGKLPPSPSERPPCPPCPSQEAPPPVRGCAVGGSGSSLGLWVLLLGWRRRRERCLVRGNFSFGFR